VPPPPPPLLPPVPPLPPPPPPLCRLRCRAPTAASIAAAAASAAVTSRRMMEDRHDHQEEGALTMLRQSDLVKEIMGKVVATKSAINYAYQNGSFALFCYGNEVLRENLLEPWFSRGLAQRTTPKAKTKYLQECFLACSTEDDDCPFILSNLTFPHFSNFLSTRTRTKGKNKGKQNSLGVASYDQAKSTLVHLFRMSKYDIPAEFADNLKIFMKGMKRTVAAKKMEDGDSGIIGKKKMDFKVFKKICALFLKEEAEEFLFAHCFLVLEWNLMSRSDNIVHAHLFHITWEDDCLAFRFCKKQNGPDGEEQRSGVACLCHTRQSCNLSCSCPCNLCVRQSRSNKCGEFHRD
jgi:hypothetical protein